MLRGFSRHFARRQFGGGNVEYGILLALIALSILSFLALTGDHLDDLFAEAGNEVNQVLKDDDLGTETPDPEVPYRLVGLEDRFGLAVSQQIILTDLILEDAPQDLLVQSLDAALLSFDGALWEQELIVPQGTTFQISAVAPAAEDQTLSYRLLINAEKNYVWRLSTAVAGTYNWSFTEFPECSLSCGLQTHSRDVTCINENDDIVEEALCLAVSEKPPSVLNCTGTPNVIEQCDVDNGMGQHSCNSSGTGWGTCEVTSCLEGYYAWEGAECVTDCLAQELQGYQIPALLHNASLTVSKVEDLGNGENQYSAQAQCQNGVVTLTEEELTQTECEEGLIPVAGQCVSGCSAGTYQGYDHPDMAPNDLFESTKQVEIDNGVINYIGTLKCFAGEVTLLFESQDEASIQCSEGTSATGFNCYLDCTAGSLEGYDYGALTHGTTENVYKTISIPGGLQDRSALAICLDGDVTIAGEVASDTQCEAGYALSGEQCNGPCYATEMDGFSMVDAQHGEQQDVSKILAIDGGTQQVNAIAICDGGTFKISGYQVASVQCEGDATPQGTQCLNQCPANPYTIDGTAAYDVPLLDHTETAAVSGTMAVEGGVSNVRALARCNDGTVTFSSRLFDSVQCEAGKSPSANYDACFDDCPTGTITSSGVTHQYNYMTNGEIRQILSTQAVMGGDVSYIAKLSCYAGNVSVSSQYVTDVVCEAGYDRVGNSCESYCPAGSYLWEASSVTFDYGELRPNEIIQVEAISQETSGSKKYSGRLQCLNGEVKFTSGKLEETICEAGYNFENFCGANCTAGSFSTSDAIVFDHEYMVHSTSYFTHIGHKEIAGGVQEWTAGLRCFDGTLSVASKSATGAVCENGFSREGIVCKQSCAVETIDGYALPAKAHKESVTLAQGKSIYGGNADYQATFSCTDGVWKKDTETVANLNCSAGYSANSDATECGLVCSAGTSTVGNITYSYPSMSHTQSEKISAQQPISNGIKYLSSFATCQDGVVGFSSNSFVSVTCEDALADGQNCLANCDAGTRTIQGEEIAYAALQHGEKIEGSFATSIDGGTQSYDYVLTCQEGGISASSAWTNSLCDAGYILEDKLCKQHCPSGEVSSGGVTYAHTNLDHKQAMAVTGLLTISGGERDYSAQATCSDGSVAVSSASVEATRCEEGYTASGTNCYRNCTQTSYSYSGVTYEVTPLSHGEQQDFTATTSDAAGNYEYGVTLACNNGSLSRKSYEFIGHSCNEGYVADGTTCRQNCEAGTTSYRNVPYSYPALIHNNVQIVTSDYDITGGQQSWSAEAKCYNGRVTISTEKLSNVSCDAGYTEYSTACYESCTAGDFTYSNVTYTHPEMKHNERAYSQGILETTGRTQTYNAELWCNSGRVNYVSSTISETRCDDGYSLVGSICYQNCPAADITYQSVTYSHANIDHDSYISAIGIGDSGNYQAQLRCYNGSVSVSNPLLISGSCPEGQTAYNGSCYQNCSAGAVSYGGRSYPHGELGHNTNEIVVIDNPITNGIQKYRASITCNNGSASAKAVSIDDVTCDADTSLYNNSCYKNCTAGVASKSGVSYEHGPLKHYEKVSISKIVTDGENQFNYVGVLSCNNGNVSVSNSTAIAATCGPNETAIGTSCYENCAASSYTYSSVEYAYDAINHGEKYLATGTKTVNNGTETWSSILTCNNGAVSITNAKVEDTSCDANTTVIGGKCYQNCGAGTFVRSGRSYEYSAFNHGDVQTVATEYNLSQGVQQYQAELQCSNGAATYKSEEIVGVSCNTGYSEYNNSCYRKCAAGTSGGVYDYPEFDHLQDLTLTATQEITGGFRNRKGIVRCQSGTVYLISNQTVSTVCNAGYTEDADSCYQICPAGTAISGSYGYDHGQMAHDETTSVTKIFTINNGQRTVRGDLKCSNGAVSVTRNITEKVACDAGYSVNGISCTQDCPAGTLDKGAVIYEHGYIKNDESSYVEANYNISGGYRRVRTRLSCSGGSLLAYAPSILSVTCDEGYRRDDISCYQNCQSGQKDVNGVTYHYQTLAHDQTSYVSGEKTTAEGRWNYQATAKCSNGTVSISSISALSVDCASGYTRSGEKCYQNCQVTETTSGGVTYNHGSLTHGQVKSVIGQKQISGGVQDYSATAKCWDGGVSVSSVSITGAGCQSGYSQEGDRCYQNCSAQEQSGFTLQASNHGQSQSVSKSESYSWGSRLNRQTATCQNGRFQFSFESYAELSCIANYAPNSVGNACFTCGVDSYNQSGATSCSAVGTGYYSPHQDLNRYACRNKPENSFYSGSGQGSDNCPWICLSGFKEEVGACLPN